MTTRRWRRLISIVLLAAMGLLLAGCSPAAPASQTGGSAGQSAGKPSNLKVAMILPGTIQDADFNTIGYETLKALEKQFGVATAYSESVAVADSERVAREYISSGYNVIAFHGGQFVTIVTKLAGQFPDVSFIMESAGQVPDLPPNVWNIGRKQYEPFYAVGVLAALSTKTNKIGYVAGVKLPDFVGILNSVKQAVQETNPKAQVVYAFVGDQNDPIKARSAVASQINDGADFIISSVNLGMSGVAEAAKAAPSKALLTTFMTQKKDLAPDLMTVSVLYDFTPPFSEALKGIQEGKRGGYLEMRAGRGFTLSPITNVPDDVAKKTRDAFDAVAQGNKQVQEVTDRVLGE